MQNAQLVFTSYVGISEYRLSAEDADELLTHVLSSEDVFRKVFDNWALLEPTLRYIADRSVFWLFDACFTLKQKGGYSPKTENFPRLLADHMIIHTSYGEDPAEYLEIPFERCGVPANKGSKIAGLALAARCIRFARIAHCGKPLIAGSCAVPEGQFRVSDERRPKFSEPVHKSTFASSSETTSCNSKQAQTHRPSIYQRVAPQARPGPLDIIIRQFGRLNVIETSIDQNEPLIAALAVQIIQDPQLTDVSVLILGDCPRYCTFASLVANVSGSPVWWIDERLEGADDGDAASSDNAIQEAESLVKQWCYSSRVKILSAQPLTIESASARILPHIEQLRSATNSSHVMIFIDSHSLWGDLNAEGIKAFAEAMQCILRLADLSNSCSIVALSDGRFTEWHSSEARSAILTGGRLSCGIQTCDRVFELDVTSSDDLEALNGWRNTDTNRRTADHSADDSHRVMTLSHKHGASAATHRKLVLEVNYDRAQLKLLQRDT